MSYSFPIPPLILGHTLVSMSPSRLVPDLYLSAARAFSSVVLDTFSLAHLANVSRTSIGLNLLCLPVVLVLFDVVYIYQTQLHYILFQHECGPKLGNMSVYCYCNSTLL